MSVRLYWSPIIGDGLSPATAYRASVPGARCRAVIPAHPRYTVDGDPNASAGTPRWTHTLAIATATDWAAADADATQLLLLPDINAGTVRQLLAAIAARTVADIPQAYRARWVTMLTALNVRRDDVSGTMPVRKLLRRVLVALDPQGAHDDALFR